MIRGQPHHFLYTPYLKHGRLDIGLVAVRLPCGLYSANLLLISTPLSPSQYTSKNGHRLDPAMRTSAVLASARLYILSSVFLFRDRSNQFEGGSSMGTAT